MRPFRAFVGLCGLVACSGAPSDTSSAASLSSSSGCLDIATNAPITITVGAPVMFMNPHYSGFNNEDTISPVSPTNPAYKFLVGGLYPGFWRTGGTPTQGFDYATERFNTSWKAQWWNGNVPQEWGQFVGGSSPEVAPNAGNLQNQAVMAYETGASRVIVVINTANADRSAAAAAAYRCYANNLGCDYELGNESYFDGTESINGCKWNGGDCPGSVDGYAYMRAIQPYIDAILSTDVRTNYDIIAPLKLDEGVSGGSYTVQSDTCWNVGREVGCSKWGVLDWLADHPSYDRVNAVAVHSYPCSGDATSYACINDFIDNHANDLAKQVVALAGGRHAYFTEFSTGIEGGGPGGTTVIARPYDGNIRGTQFGAMAVVATMMKFARHGIWQTAYQKLYGNYFAAIDVRDHGLTRARGDTDGYDFGFYYTASGLALRIMNEAIRGKAVMYDVSSSDESTVMGWAVGNNDGGYHLVLVNRTNTPKRVAIQWANGHPWGSGQMGRVEGPIASGGGTGYSRNEDIGTTPSSGPFAHDYGGSPTTQVVETECTTNNQYFDLPSYGVARVGN